MIMKTEIYSKRSNLKKVKFTTCDIQNGLMVEMEQGGGLNVVISNGAYCGRVKFMNMDSGKIHERPVVDMVENVVSRDWRVLKSCAIVDRKYLGCKPDGRKI